VPLFGYQGSAMPIDSTYGIFPMGCNRFLGKNCPHQKLSDEHDNLDAVGHLFFCLTTGVEQGGRISLSDTTRSKVNIFINFTEMSQQM